MLVEKSRESVSRGRAGWGGGVLYVVAPSWLPQDSAIASRVGLRSRSLYAMQRSRCKDKVKCKQGEDAKNVEVLLLLLSLLSEVKFEHCLSCGVQVLLCGVFMFTRDVLSLFITVLKVPSLA
jgi:hypothetical protein